MNQPTPARAGDDRARTHIKALATEAKTLTEGTADTPAMAFGSGMLTGLAAAVQILDGGTAEAAMETIVQRLEGSIGKAYLDGSLPATPPPTRDQIATVIREFPFDNYGMDDVSYALAASPETQEWVPALADAVLAAVHTDAELRAQLTAAIAALGASETELAQLRRRQRLAHKARRAKEHQLDGIRRALCDIGAIEDDDPYSHADLEDVIRQAGRLDELSAAVAADLNAEADRADADQPVPPIGCPTPDLPPGFGTVAPCTAPRPDPDPISLREQLAAPLDRILGDWPEHNRADEHEAVRNEITEAVLAVIPPGTRVAADRARNAEAEVQRVVDLYERWVKAGPPPLGAPLARWWDARLVELREAVLGTKEPS